MRHGGHRGVWPAALLLLATGIPAVCLLWFMSAAMRNERLAVRQKLADVCRSQLSAARARLEQSWQDTAAELQNLAGTNPAPAAFAQCVRSGLVSSVILFDDQGRILYPNTPGAAPNDSSQLDLPWHEASQLEHVQRYPDAATRYDKLARTATNANHAARALQAQARCLAQAGLKDAALQLINGPLQGPSLAHAPDRQGRLIVANAELLALELMTNHHAPAFQFIAQRLAARVQDYDNPTLAAPQRRFLMKELQRLSPEAELVAFPTLAAEELARDWCENHPAPADDSAAWHRAQLPRLWQAMTPNRRVLALANSDKLLAAAQRALIPDSSVADTETRLVPPETETPEAFVTLPAGAAWPGWRLALSLKDRSFFEATAGRQTAVYFWTGLLVMALMGVLTWIALRLVRRQVTLARLKSDLAATVSHELKTPLASTRVLVETLLESEQFDPGKTREYLELIAQENARLARLVQNFLTFSRMERDKDPFHFAFVPARQLIETAQATMRARLEAAGCDLEVRLEADLPLIRGDADALVTVLVNLLENACKYSEDAKRIVLRAHAVNGSVLLSVTDHGIGIAPRERKKIFQPFYRVDSPLSRPGGGCGLGLSIVRFITKAHHGCVHLESQPGRGSTFTISLPAAPDSSRAGPETAS